MPDVSAEGRRVLSGNRQVIVGLGVLLLALPLWWGTDHFVPSLTAKRVVATAICYTLHDASEAQLRGALIAARTQAAAVEATFEPGGSPDGHGATYYLSVTADTPEKARSDLAAFTDAIKIAFPLAERNLLVSTNNSTVPESNELGRRVTFGLRTTVILMILGGQFLTVIGGHRAGFGRAGLLGTLAWPVVVFIAANGDSGGTRRRAGHGQPFELPDWHFVVLFLALTLVSVILSLWLTRRKRPADGRPRS